MAYTNEFLEKPMDYASEVNYAIRHLRCAYRDTKANGWEVLVIRDIGFAEDAVDMVNAMKLFHVDDVLVTDRSTAVMAYLTTLVENGWRVVGTSTVKANDGYTFGYHAEIKGLHMKLGE